jgi:endoglucanase
MLRGFEACILTILFTAALSFTGSQPTQAQSQDYLHTDGNRILDAHDHQVILTGISWFGLETESFAPHGLWARNWESILDQIVKLGFNTIRLPFSNQLLDPSSVPNSINYELNPDLKGLNGLEIMDKIIQGAGKRGLKVILDRHRPDSHAQSELWYTPQFSEERWIKDWVDLAKRYAGNDAVIGVDLHNEPHGKATWGSGDPATDWRLAAEKAGNAILAANPNLLIIVQGIEQYKGDWYWWGGNLMGARSDPVRLDVPDRLVYSTHTYGPGVYPQPWFSDPSFPDNLPGIWDSHWGYLNKEGIAPVIVGEFGGRSVGTDKEGIWQKALFSYLRENNISYIYWTINPDSGDTGGLLLDDWQSIDKAKQAMLSGYQFPIIGIEQQGPTPTPAAAQATPNPVQDTPTPATITGKLSLRYRTANPASQATDSKPEFIISNTGDTPIPLGRVELLYWFKDTSSQPFVFHCDWAQVGCPAITGDFHAVGDYQYLSMHFDPSAGVLAPGQDSGEIKIRFNRADWSAIRQEDQYSYAPLTEYSQWDKVTLDLDGKLVWGIEPAHPIASSPSTQPPSTQTNPSASSPATQASLTPAPALPLASGQVETPAVAVTETAQPTATETLLPAATEAIPAGGGNSSVSLVLFGVLAVLAFGVVAFQIGRKSASGPKQGPGKSSR